MNKFDKIINEAAGKIELVSLYYNHFGGSTKDIEEWVDEQDIVTLEDYPDPNNPVYASPRKESKTKQWIQIDLEARMSQSISTMEELVKSFEQRFTPAYFVTYN
jgi:hypothetical protein